MKTSSWLLLLIVLMVSVTSTASDSPTVTPATPHIPTTKPIKSFVFAWTSTLADIEMTNLTAHNGCREYNPFSSKHPGRLEMYSVQLPILAAISWWSFKKHKAWPLYTVGGLHSAGMLVTFTKGRDCL